MSTSLEPLQKDSVISAGHSHEELCRERLSARATDARRLARRLRRIISNKRRLIFAVVGLAVIDASGGNAFLLVPLFIFLIPIVVIQNRTGRALDRASRTTAFYRQLLARFSNGWISSDRTGDHYLTSDEVFADDLDLFGTGSLFQFLSVVEGGVGKDTLALWLTRPADVDEILNRQSAIRELTHHLQLCEQFATLDTNSGVLHSREFIAWIDAPPILPSRGTRMMGWVIAVALAGVLFSGVEIGHWISIAAIVTSIAFYFVFRNRLRQTCVHGPNAMMVLSYLTSVKAELRKSSFESRKLSDLKRIVSDVAAAPPPLIGWVYDLLLHFPFLMFVICQFIPFVDSWRRLLGKTAIDGLRAVGEYEALISLALYSFVRPEATIPTLEKGGKCYEAHNLGHPLIRSDKRVGNDILLNETTLLLLVSGSNMSGKSTMLRTVGINAVLAITGAPVCADRMRISPLAIGTAMRFHDSLEKGTSYFFEAITRLKRVMDIDKGDRPLLFLLDEILQGTNSQDRILGAEALLKKLVERGDIGLITTHDLELTRIVDALDSRAANVHFVDSLVDDEIHFDYKMRPGVVKTSNALTLMRKVGLDI